MLKDLASGGGLRANGFLFPGMHLLEQSNCLRWGELLRISKSVDYLVRPDGVMDLPADEDSCRFPGRFTFFHTCNSANPITETAKFFGHAFSVNY